jgi:hypothetical protein
MLRSSHNLCSAAMAHGTREGEKPHGIPGDIKAFTLIELLVSAAVLLVLILMVTSLVNNTRLVITGSRAHIEADTAARQVMDRIASDVLLMVKRRDVNYIFFKQAGNDAMFFFSGGPAYAGSTISSANLSRVNLIGYRVAVNNSVYHDTLGANMPVLERLGQALTWDGVNSGNSSNPGGMVYLTTGTGPTIASTWHELIGVAPYTSATNSAYQVLNSQVFRMEICFLLKSGTFALSGTSFSVNEAQYSNIPTAAPKTFVSSGYESDGNVYGIPPDLAGIVVAIAVMDDTTRKQITASQLVNVASKLGDSTGNGTQLPAEIWQNAVEGQGFAKSVGMSQAVASRIRIYQRIITL